jgi:hypothetical protein
LALNNNDSPTHWFTLNVHNEGHNCRYL